MHEDNRRDIDHLAREKTSEPASESVGRSRVGRGVTRRIGYTLFRRVWARRRGCIRLASSAEVAAAKTQLASLLSTFHFDPLNPGGAVRLKRERAGGRRTKASASQSPNGIMERWRWLESPPLPWQGESSRRHVNNVLVTMSNEDEECPFKVARPLLWC